MVILASFRMGLVMKIVETKEVSPNHHMIKFKKEKTETCFDVSVSFFISRDLLPFRPQGETA